MGHTLTNLLVIINLSFVTTTPPHHRIDVKTTASLPPSGPSLSLGIKIIISNIAANTTTTPLQPPHTTTMMTTTTPNCQHSPHEHPNIIKKSYSKLLQSPPTLSQSIHNHSHHHHHLTIMAHQKHNYHLLYFHLQTPPPSKILKSSSLPPRPQQIQSTVISTLVTPLLYATKKHLYFNLSFLYSPL